jgi:hypothetical protein
MARFLSFLRLSGSPKGRGGALSVRCGKKRDPNCGALFYHAESSQAVGDLTGKGGRETRRIGRSRISFPQIV